MLLPAVAEEVLTVVVVMAASVEARAGPDEVSRVEGVATAGEEVEATVMMGGMVPAVLRVVVEAVLPVVAVEAVEVEVVLKGIAAEGVVGAMAGGMAPAVFRVVAEAVLRVVVVAVLEIVSEVVAMVGAAVSEAMVSGLMPEVRGAVTEAVVLRAVLRAKLTDVAGGIVYVLRDGCGLTGGEKVVLVECGRCSNVG
jgi:hypothetical protein